MLAMSALVHGVGNGLGVLAIWPSRLKVVGYLECVDRFGHDPIPPDARGALCAFGFVRDLPKREWLHGGSVLWR